MKTLFSTQVNSDADRPRRGVALRLVGLVALALTLLALTLLAPMSVIAEAQPVRDHDAKPVHDRPTDREELRLGCAVDIIDGERGVLCRWSQATNDTVRGYQLYRIVNGAPRELVATVPAGDRLHAFDTDLAAGDRVIYGVVARNAAGRVIGIGGPVRLGIGR